MSIFNITNEKLQTLYHRAWIEANRGYVDPRKYSYLNHALMQYAKENNCSYDNALVVAKTGNKLF